MIKIKNRAGTSQDGKFVAALQPDYVSVEERSTIDLLMYLREYVQKVIFYDKDNPDNNSWKAFLDFSDNEILELAELVENPAVFSDDTGRRLKYSKPHLALLLTFIKLLQYPKEQFAELTEKNVEFFYKDILKLKEQDEVPDQVHVIFNLARDVQEYLLKKGTLLNAGKDDTGADLQYVVTEDVVLNNEEVSDIKTIHYTKEVTNLKYIHQNNNRRDAGFEKMLCLVLGNLSNLPPYNTASGRSIPVNAVYLRTELYQRIKGKERDELESCDAEYIFQSLCFRSLKEFMACLDLLYREINHGYVGVTSPSDLEWEEAYKIFEGVHQERIARSRRDQLKSYHKEYGFEGMMEYAFGEPEPGNMLYKMPVGIANLEDLAKSSLEAARQYIESKLCMTVADFKTVLAKKDSALTSIAGDEVYAILEAAWTQKRGYRYPEIGAEIITGFYADTIFSEDQDKAIERFSAFGKSSIIQSSEPVNMGFAVSSPLLQLREGTREINMVISCKEGSIDYDKISALLAKNQALFTTNLSVNGGWQEVSGVEFEVGKFIIKPELKSYNREDSSLICDITEFTFFDQNYVGAYIGFANGKVYKIENVDDSKREIRLRTVNLEHPGGSAKLIKRLKPKNFVTELKTALIISPFTQNVCSTETFDQNFQGKYMVDQEGKIFFITKFISASEIELSYCGAIRSQFQGVFDENDLLLLNKVWETVELEYEENSPGNDISNLQITAINSAKRDFAFTVTDAALKISYPEGATAQKLISAWEAWKDDPQNNPGQYEIKGDGSVLAEIPESSKELELTGEVIKRYEALANNGIRVTYKGRPSEPANLVVKAPSDTIDQAAFLVSGGVLTITPGRISRTANQIAADWRLWLEDPDNDPDGFRVESKDRRLWQANRVDELNLTPLDRQVKKCEICNLYGVGIRVWYTGPLADHPKLVLQENTIDMFEFERSKEQILTIKYPSQSEASANDLAEAWEEWKDSELNDPGNFSIEVIGDGLWSIQARTEKELQASENQIIECTCTLDDKTPIGIIARYKLSSDYQNAIVRFVKHGAGDDNPDDFSFSYSDIFDEKHGYVKTKVLTITYPSLNESVPPDRLDESQKQQLQMLLSKWNRENKKQGFSLVRTADNAQWPLGFPDNLNINFLDALNYICTIDPDGFVVKYRPVLAEDWQVKEIPRAKVVIQENDPKVINNAFVFQLNHDYSSNLKILYIKYPTDKKQRTVAGLLTAWEARKAAIPKDVEDEFSEFDLFGSGTQKWEITGISKIDLNTEVTAGTWITDPVKQQFFEYKTSDVNGFTLYYTGPEGVRPQVTMAEHELDSFGFQLQFGKDEYYDVDIAEKLTINYPKRVDKRRIEDLLTGWHDYQNSFRDGGPTLRTFVERELQSSENGITECAIADAGIIARYKLSDEYPNAIIEFVANTNPVATKFSFSFSDVYDPEHDNLKTKQLRIIYPPLPVSPDPIIDSNYQIRQVQSLLSLWNQEPYKFGFSLSIKNDGAKWSKNFTSRTINFKDDQNYIGAIEPDGYIVKYKPVGFVSPFTKEPLAKVVSYENTGDAFAFQLLNDYQNNYKLLVIKYPTVKKHRTVKELLKAWNNKAGSLLETGSLYWQVDGELREFELVETGKTSRIIGFEIADTSLVVEKRVESELLISGDLVREYHLGNGNGICISYTGHREDPKAVLEPIQDFNDTMIGQKILWENGEVFTITSRENTNQVTVRPENKNISRFNAIKLFETDAICFDAFKFTLRIDADFPAVVPMVDTDFSVDPGIKIMLKRATSAEQQDSVADFYNCFKTVHIQRIDLKVTVKGLKDLKMRGNIAMINPANPFMPFGQTPDESARFYFANPEICEKKLNWMQLNLKWTENQFLNEAGLPDMEQYYYTYSHSGLKTLGTIKNEDFEVKLQFLDQRAWVPISNDPQVFFSEYWLYNDFNRQTYQGNLFSSDQTIPKDPLDWPRYYELDLFNQGFMKDFYPELVSYIGRATRNLEAAQNDYDVVKQEIKSRLEQIKAAKLAEIESSESHAGYYVPVIPKARELPEIPENDRDISKMTLNAPYTPVIQSLTIDYEASSVIMLNPVAGNTGAARIPIRLFRFNPFGYEEMGKTDDGDDFLLPQYNQEGYLMIGIKNVEPLQNVSLLFQIVSGSGDANLATPEITWSYLSDNKWLPFKQSGILKDRTFGLQDTGIIRFSIPETVMNGNTLMPGNLCWIRAEAPENITAVPDILDIRARAVCLTYLDRNNDPKHLTKPMAAETITDMTIRESAVKDVSQPYSSFNGRPAESDQEFFTRVSERLKHKNRALLLDDYEILILAQFPQIYKVKCIPQNELDLFEPSSHGEVVAVVILKNANATPFFPLKPKTPANLLGEIKNFIQTLMPPQVKVIIRNPRFEEVRYRLAVKFTDGYDRGFYINKIMDDIKRYLSPWAYQQEAVINFGSSVYSSSLINYLENQDYVDYIANFNPLQQVINHETYTEIIPLFLTEDNEVSAKYPDSILVSADNHIIDVITTEFYDPGAFRGIGHMKIETDFWIDRPGAIFSVGLGQMEIEAWPVMRYAFIDIPVTVTASAVIHGQNYPLTEITTRFSRADARKIWDVLWAKGVLDRQGNVITSQELFADNFYLFGEAGEFANYLTINLSSFQFQLKAADFGTTAGKEDEFNYSVQTIDTRGLETAFVNIIKTGQDFDGSSQYPFIVY